MNKLYVPSRSKHTSGNKFVEMLTSNFNIFIQYGFPASRSQVNIKDSKFHSETSFFTNVKQFSWKELERILSLQLLIGYAHFSTTSRRNFHTSGVPVNKLNSLFRLHLSKIYSNLHTLVRRYSAPFLTIICILSQSLNTSTCSCIEYLPL